MESSKKLVEFFIDTDSDSESCTSSEGVRKDEKRSSLVERGPPPLIECLSPPTLIERGPPSLAEESDSEMEYEKPAHLSQPPKGNSFYVKLHLKGYDSHNSYF